MIDGTQKHADGRILNMQGECVGRWDDNVHGVRQWALSHNQDPDIAENAWRQSSQSHRPVVIRVEGYYEANKHRRGGGQNWLRVLVAFGQYRERNIKPYSAAEAWESAKVWDGWKEVAQALEKLEDTNYEYAHGYDPQASAYQQDGTDGYVAPDDPRWGNERQAEGDAGSQIAPEHVERFVAYLERERDLVAKECGSAHPAVKCKVYEAYIEDVRSGERVHSQIMFNYEQFLGWLRGEYGQRTAAETTLWADGTEDDHTDLAADDPTPPAEKPPGPDAAYKADQAAYAEEVKQFQAARDAGDPDAQQGFDEWKRLQTPEGKLFRSNGIYVEDARTGCIIPNDRVFQRRDELTADNVRYRLSAEGVPDGIRFISWLALNYEGCLCTLPHNTETKTRMVPAEEVQDLIWAGHRVLTHKEYAKNQRVIGAREDRFENFRLWAQYSPSGKLLGVCPTQGDPSDGKWKHNEELFARLHGHTSEEIAPVDAPVNIANAIQAGDWAEVARLARERAAHGNARRADRQAPGGLPDAGRFERWRLHDYDR